MIHNFYRSILALAILVALIGCSRHSQEESGEAGAVVARFREEARNGNHLAIYRSGTESFRSSVSEDRWLKISTL